MRHMLIALAIGSSVSAVFGATAQEDGLPPSTCMAYSASLTSLSGEISAAKTAYPRGARGASRYKEFHLQLATAICVKRGPIDDGLEPQLDHVEEIELGATTAEEYRALQGVVGRVVQCTGSIVPPVTRYHLADVILRDPKCVLVSSPESATTIESR